MYTIQEKINKTSKKIAIILKIGGALLSIIALLSMIAISILTFSGEKTKSSFISAFDVIANNGAVLHIAPQALIVMFVFMLIDALLILSIIYFLHSIFAESVKYNTPFCRKNVSRMKAIAIIAIVLSLIGSFSDALVDFYTINQMAWRFDIVGIVIGIIIYCIAFVFQYGCELQQQADETL